MLYIVLAMNERNMVQEEAWLLRDKYKILDSSEFVPSSQQFVHATQVRQAMAKNYAWEHLVPGVVVDYIKKNHLDERFRREFSYVTLRS